MTRAAVTLSASLLLYSSNSLNCPSTILAEKNILKQWTLCLQIFPIKKRVPKRRSGKIVVFFWEKEKNLDQNLQESEKCQEVQKIHFLFDLVLFFLFVSDLFSCYLFFHLIIWKNWLICFWHVFIFLSVFLFFLLFPFFLLQTFFCNTFSSFCFIFYFYIPFFISFFFSPKTIILLVSNNLNIYIKIYVSFFCCSLWSHLFIPSLFLFNSLSFFVLLFGVWCLDSKKPMFWKKTEILWKTWEIANEGIWKNLSFCFVRTKGCFFFWRTKIKAHFLRRSEKKN